MVIDWLSASDAYVVYATQRWINASTFNFQDLHQQVLEDPRILRLLYGINNFNSTIVTTHKNPDLPIHQLNFLLDIGLGQEVKEIMAAGRQIYSNLSPEGIYQSIVNVPVHYHGTGQDTLGWALCDAPLMLYALRRLGYDFNRDLKAGVDQLVSFEAVNGFPCKVSQALGTFRGPGRKQDCCPYATMVMLKMLSVMPREPYQQVIDRGIETLLQLWTNSRQEHPYMFSMGTDFRKLKAPTIWYDLVSMCEVLGEYPQIYADDRYQEMLDLLLSKADGDFRFTPQSIYQKCSAFDFGEKKSPSPWLTMVCLKILVKTGKVTLQQLNIQNP